MAAVKLLGGLITFYPGGDNYGQLSYHGSLIRCRKAPDPKPFETVTIKPLGEEWEVIADFDIYLPRYKFYRFSISLFPASSDDDKCPDKWPDGKNHYYFAEVKGYRCPGSTWMSFIKNSGLICDNPRDDCNKTYMRKVWFDIYCKKFNYLFYLSHLCYGSHATVWRSKTGEFPGYFPIYQKDICTGELP